MSPAARPPKRRALFSPLRLHLPESVGLEGIAVFAELSAQLANLAQSGSTAGNSRWQTRKTLILAQVKSSADLTAWMREPADLRLLLSLWRDNTVFFQTAPPDAAFMQRLQRDWPQPSRLLLWQLIQLYLERYDSLDSAALLATYLQHTLAGLGARPHESQDLKIYRQQAATLFGKEGPGALLRAARRNEALAHGLSAALKAWAVPELSRYAQACKRRYYLAPLAELALGAASPLFAELSDERVKSAPLEDELLVGHHAACLLMDKVLAAKADLPENWRQLILNLMGDPRVPRSSPSFQAWWGRVDARYASAMRTWLSKLDLKLFLNILEEVARSHDRTDLLRMFPARKRLLEGLHAQGLIRESRLLLGKQAEKYIRAHFEAGDLPSFGQLSSSDASVIYLNLQGIHLLEGTHFFQMRLYQDLPILGLADYETDKFSLAEMRKYPADVTIKHSHSPLPRWQHELIATLGAAPFNLAIDPQQVLSKTDYRAYVAAFFSTDATPTAP